MSNSGGDEDRLSTPTEESVEDDVNENDRGDHATTVKTVSGTKVKPSAKMTRSNLSDHEAIDDSKIPRRLAQVSEENAVLKRQLKKQEERIKILATKLIRVISERSNKTKREEILLEEQKARIADLEHEVSNLRDKLQVSKQQLSSYTRLIPHHYHPPPSRQASMLSSSSLTSHSKAVKKTRSASGGSAQPPRPSTATSSRGNLLNDKNFADRVEELLLEAKAENQALEDQLKNCRQRLASTEESLEKLKETLANKEAEHKEEILSIKSQLGKEEDIAKKKKQLSDNIQLIRLQRESRRTASWLSTLEAQNRALEGNLAGATENVQQLEVQLSEAQEELSQEQQKNISLQKQMEDATSSLSRLKELEAQISSLQEENKILQETNESLLKNAFSVKEKAEKAESVENNARSQMVHLETALKAEMRSKSDIQESLRVERERYSRLEATNTKLQEKLDKFNEDMRQRGAFCCGTNNQTSACVHVHSDSATTTSSTNIENASDCTDKITDTCPNQKKLLELEKELENVKSELESERAGHEKSTLLLKSQMADIEKYQSKIEELALDNKKADDFHCKKLHELVKGLEERKKQISHLEKCMDEWKRQQSSTNVSCKVCESREKLAAADSNEEVTVQNSNLSEEKENAAETVMIEESTSKGCEDVDD